MRPVLVLSRPQSHSHHASRWVSAIAKLVGYGLVFTVIGLFSRVTFAQQLPTAGTEIQQITQIPPLIKAPPKLDVEIKAPEVINVPSNARKIEIKSIQIKGIKNIAAADLIAASGFVPNSMLSFEELKNLTQKMVAYLHEKQYFVAQVFLPPQAISDGVVIFEVMEGKYSKVELKGNGVIPKAMLTALMGKVKSGEPIKANDLERGLLLVSDLPGVLVSSNLSPGQVTGTSDLVVEVEKTALLSGSVDYDNFGNTYTGVNRVGGTLNINNPSGNGDIVTLRAQTSAEGMNYGRASYQGQADVFKPGIALTSMQYQLGQQYQSLSAYGRANIASVYTGYPVIRSRDANLNMLLNFDLKQLNDNVRATNTMTPKKAEVASFNINGDSKDQLLGGGFNTYYSSFSVGNIVLQNQQSITNDAQYAQTNGTFNKLYLNTTRLQNIAGPLSLYGAFRGQFASKNMDGTEKMGLGGANGVRAYPEGEGYGDQGYLLNIEARTNVPNPFSIMPGQLQLIGFFDNGSIMFNKNPWPGAGINNHQTLSGAGVGLNWTSQNNLVLRSYLAHKVGGAAPTSAPDQTYRFWVQLIQYL